ncbi:MAG TPA: hypothetical protein PL072_10235 [Phycisphaerales bacterium]|nr:hypothetical protein [Phycisphaerales bacterium]
MSTTNSEMAVAGAAGRGVGRARAAIGGAVLGLVLCAGSVMGQTALGDGHALDANNRVGSGGRNTPVRDLAAQIRFNNAVITGQAAGGKSFRGDAGYGAANEFRGQTASDVLYTFQRDSAYSGLVGTGIRGTDALRYQFALSTGAVVPGQFAGTYGAVGRAPTATGTSAVSRVAPGDATSVLRSTSQFLAQRSLRPTVVGYDEDGQGGRYALAASPLMGVSLYKTEQEELKGSRPNALPTIPGAEEGKKELTPEQKAREEQRKRMREVRVYNPFTGLEPSAAGLPSAIDRLGTDVTARIDTAIPTTLVEAITPAHQQVIDKFKSGYEAGKGEGAAGGAGAQPGDQLTWEEQLVRMRAVLRGENPAGALKAYEKEREERKRNPEGAPGSTAPGSAAPGTAEPGAGASGTGVPGAAPTVGNDKEMKAEAERVERELAAMQSAGRKLGLSASTIKALKSAGVNFERLDAGMTPSNKTGEPDMIYQGHMEAGQRALGNGKWFDAEERFTRAMAAAPGEPMAVVGRVHAQIGAGLYLSAAQNLRRLFTDHPELVASRFAPEIGPQGQRAEEIKSRLRDELGKATEKSALGRDAGLLLAYLGHLESDTDAVRQGLAEFVRRVPEGDTADAALGELLKAVWTEEKQP